MKYRIIEKTINNGTPFYLIQKGFCGIWITLKCIENQTTVDRKFWVLSEAESFIIRDKNRTKPIVRERIIGER